VWEALLAIAEAAGEDWLKRAHVAAVTLVTAAAEREPSLGIRLLADLREIFGEAEQMTTQSILVDLHNMKEAPWNDLRGKPIDDRRLAFRLREYGIKSRTLNLGGEQRAKGYVREDLHDAWGRYLTPPPSPLPSITSVTSVPGADLRAPGVTDVTGNGRSVTDDLGEENPDESSTGTDVTDVTLAVGGGGRGDEEIY